MKEIGINQQLCPQIQQKLLMTAAMQQALYVLQLPVIELSEWVQAEIENNPVLEITLPADETDTSYRAKREASSRKQHREEFLENLLAAPPSLFDHLMAQARCQFHDADDLFLAQWIIGHLN